MVRTIKPAVSTFIIFSLLPSVLLIILVIQSIQNEKINYLFLIIVLILSSLIYLWLLRSKIELNEEDIIITRLFSSSLISIQKINEINILIVPSNKAKYEMIISHNSVGQKSPVRINIKLFSKKDLQFLANYLTEKNTNAKFDDKFTSMKNGKMPSIFN